MTQSSPSGDLPGFGPSREPFIARFGPPPLPEPRADDAVRDDDPFTGPLLQRWADGQFRRVAETRPELDLWSSISRRLKR